LGSRGTASGAGTNLKVGGTGPAQSAGKQIWLCPSTFLALKVHLGPSRFGVRFSYGEYSLVSFLFAVLLLTVPPCPAVCKSVGNVPTVPYGVGATRRMSLWLTKCHFQVTMTKLKV